MNLGAFYDFHPPSSISSASEVPLCTCQTGSTFNAIQILWQYRWGGGFRRHVPPD